jgi:hypothetical protein
LEHHCVFRPRTEHEIDHGVKGTRSDAAAKLSWCPWCLGGEKFVSRGSWRIGKPMIFDRLRLTGKN